MTSPSMNTISQRLDGDRECRNEMRKRDEIDRNEMHKRDEQEMIDFNEMRERMQPEQWVKTPQGEWKQKEQQGERASGSSQRGSSQRRGSLSWEKTMNAKDWSDHIGHEEMARANMYAKAKCTGDWTEFTWKHSSGWK